MNHIELYPQSRIPQYKLQERFLKDIEKKPGTERQYLGQPDMVRTRSGRLITAYPIGHGHGPVVMQISDDNGRIWTEKTDTPSSWKDCQETPTLYVLNLNTGKERILLLSACPGNWGNHSTGWDVSYSDDNGETWTEYEHFHSAKKDGTPNKVIVGMASLIQLKDEEGSPIQKWMGVYHDWDYVNYKTYLTFDEEGHQEWSEPEPYLSKYRDIEESHQICEVGLFRSPDGTRIVGLARSQTHRHLSTMFYSDDEGETWSEPLEMQGTLAGERHKAVYDPLSGRLVIVFREIIYGEKIDDTWKAGDWIAWVGTYEDLMTQGEGEYRILLAEDWSQNAKSGDTGYTGIVVLEDGTFIMDSYGHFDREYSENQAALGNYDVRKDLCYIRQAKFRLKDIENNVDDAGSGISILFENETDPGDQSWVFTGGEAVQGTFDQIGGARNYIGHFEEYARSEMSAYDNLTRQRYMINMAKKGQTLEDIVDHWDTLVTAFQPKVAAYMISVEDYRQGTVHLKKFRENLSRFIRLALAVREDGSGFAVIQKPAAVRDAGMNRLIAMYCDAVNEVVKEYQSDAGKYARIFVADHFTVTKDDNNFRKTMLNEDGSLNAAGHLEIARQFAALTMKTTENFPCWQGVKLCQKMAKRPEAVVTKAENEQKPDANQKRIADRMAKKEPMTWLFMGDSITHGLVYTLGYGGTVQYFEKYLKETLGRTSDAVINTAVSGATTTSTLNHIGQRLEKYMPDIVSIMLGTNDAAEIEHTTPDEFEANMRMIIEKIRAVNKDAVIILRSPTPMVGIDDDSVFRGPRAIENTAKVKMIAEEDPSLIYIDQYTEIDKVLKQYPWLAGEEQIFMGNWLHPGINLQLLMGKMFIKACGLWKEDNEIAQLFYEMPGMKKEPELLRELQDRV